MRRKGHDRGDRSARHWRTGLLGPLDDGPFRLLWLAATTSAGGSAFVPGALAFAVLGIGGNATPLSPVLLGGGVGGVAPYPRPRGWGASRSRPHPLLHCPN